MKYADYRRVEGFNGSILWRIIEKEMGVRTNFTEYADGSITVDTDRELTPTEKARLDVLMETPPKVFRYTLEENISDEIEAETTERPIAIIFNTDGSYEVLSMSEWTAAQKSKIEERVKGKVKRKVRG